MSQPQRFEAEHMTLVCKLHMAIYVLKQAPKAWFKRLSLPWFSLGSSQASVTLPSSFSPSTLVVVYLVVYVDDIILSAAPIPSFNT